jgi:hypothetical protein
MELFEFLTSCVDSFLLEAIPPTNERRFFLEAKIAEIGTIPASYLKYVAKTCRSDEGSFGSLAFGEDVDNRGAAMNEKPHLVWIDLREPDGLDHAVRELASRSQ